jgi:hypothetical protein
LAHNHAQIVSGERIEIGNPSASVSAPQRIVDTVVDDDWSKTPKKFHGGAGDQLSAIDVGDVERLPSELPRQVLANEGRKVVTASVPGDSIYPMGFRQERANVKVDQLVAKARQGTCSVQRCPSFGSQEENAHRQSTWTCLGRVDA